jgi:hypothetical protein
MNLSNPAQAHGAKVGNLYGWALGFLTEGVPNESTALLLTSNDYHAKIDATLPDGFNGGRVAVVIDALTDDHYRQIRNCAAADLYLFWQDVNADFLGYFSNISGLAGLGGGPSAADLAPALVLRFAFQARRRPGQRCYETVLEGRDNAYHRLSRRAAPQQCFASLADALAAIADTAQVTISPEPSRSTMLGQALLSEDEQTDANAHGLSCASALGTIVRRIAAGSRGSPEIPALRRDAPAPILLRDGAVYVGRRRMPWPMGSDPKTLDTGNGLVEAGRESEAGPDVPERWTLQCRGRPDIKAGDIVHFKKPEEDVATTLPDIGMALLGALAGPILGAAGEPPDCALLVTEVTHSLGRTSGFSTRVTGRSMPISLPFEPWSLFTTASGQEQELESQIGAGGGDPATAVARQLRDLARRAVMQVRLPEVAEVRSVVSKAGSPPEPPAQTVTVWEGTGGPSVNAHQSRRMPIKRDYPCERRGVGTVTPFAWGACGLAVPRYPGMRVMLGYVNGDVTDPIDLGATWGPDQRMDSEPGDWWLKLPVDQNAAPISDTGNHLPSGHVVNDLTDASGTRVIEVGKLTIRVGDPPEMAARPKHKASASVSIEHSDGKASISIDQDGAITIKGHTIKIDAGDGSVSIKAKDVNVSVGNKMTVGD